MARTERYQNVEKDGAVISERVYQASQDARFDGVATVLTVLVFVAIFAWPLGVVSAFIYRMFMAGMTWGLNL